MAEHKLKDANANLVLSEHHAPSAWAHDVITEARVMLVHESGQSGLDRYLRMPSPPFAEDSIPAPHRFDMLLSIGVIAAICLATALATVDARNYFLSDDFGLVSHLHRVTPGQLLSYFAFDWTEGIYGFHLDELRPLRAATYRMDAALWGPAEPAGYHATNLLIHFASALAVAAIAACVAPGARWTGLVAGGMFAALPCHAEPVAWISGRVDSLLGIFFLGAFLCFVRYRATSSPGAYAGTLLFFAAALFTKQSAVTLPILLLGYDLIALKIWRPRSHVPIFALMLSYLVLRKALFGNALREDVLVAKMFGDFVIRQPFYLWSMMPFAEGYPSLLKRALAVCLLIVSAGFGWRMVAAGAPYAGALRLVLFFGPVWYVVTISPTIVTYLSARHVYLTGAGLSIAGAILLVHSPLKGQRLRFIAITCLLALYTLAGAVAIRPWIHNGKESSRLHSSLRQVLAPIPDGSTILFAVPELQRNRYYWYFSLPFALRPPFLPEDLYSRFTFIEPAPVYCCPPEQWWAKVQPALQRLETKPVYIASQTSNGEATIRRTDATQVLPEGTRLRALVASGPAIPRNDIYEASQILFPKPDQP
jgi:hypothetical protein